MPNFKCQISTFELETNRYSKAFDEGVKTQLYQAARAFVNTAARAVPVRTGFARGAFQNVLAATGGKGAGSYQSESVIAGVMLRGEAKTPAEKVLGAFRLLKNAIRAGEVKGLGIRAENIHKSTGGKPGIPLEYYRGSGGKVLKTPQSGRRYATQPGDIFNFGSYVYSFNFEIFITYFQANDEHSNPHTPSAPWQSFKVGYTTFLNYMKTQAFKRLPKMSNFIAEITVKVDGTSKSQQKTVSIGRNSFFRIS